MDGAAVHMETGIYIQFSCNPFKDCFGGCGDFCCYFSPCNVYLLYSYFELIYYMDDIWEKIIKNK